MAVDNDGAHRKKDEGGADTNQRPGSDSLCVTMLSAGNWNLEYPLLQIQPALDHIPAGWAQPSCASASCDMTHRPLASDKRTLPETDPIPIPTLIGVP